MISFELNDLGLLAVRKADGRLIPLEDGQASSPGVALPTAEGLKTGLEAWQRARLFPTHLIADAWDRMDLLPVARAQSGLRHPADVVRAHLDRLRGRIGLEALPLVLVTPPHYSRDQLGVLLGVAQSLKLNLYGLIDAATAALARPPEADLALVLDLHLGRFSASLFTQDSGHLRRLGVATSDKAGGWALNQVLLKGVARQFVLQTRFDPCHDAAGEQELFNRLPGFLQALSAEEEEPLVLPAGGREARAVIRAASLAQLAAPAVHEALATAQDLLHRHEATGLPLHVFATHRLAVVPGLEPALQTLGEIRLTWLPEGAAGRGAFALASGTGKDGARLVTQRSYLPPAPAAPAAVSLSAATATDAPTHVLVGPRAYPLAGTPVHLAFRAERSVFAPVAQPGERDTSVRLDARGVWLFARDPSVRVNGVPAEGEVAVALGDLIAIEGTPAEARLIRCESPV